MLLDDLNNTRVDRGIGILGKSYEEGLGGGKGTIGKFRKGEFTTVELTLNYVRSLLLEFKKWQIFLS